MEINASSLRPLVLAAMTLVGGYAQAIEYTAPALRTHIECSKSDMESMRVVMSDLIDGWKELDAIYGRLLHKTLQSGEFDSDKFGRIADLLGMTRGLEVALKAATPPEAFHDLHMEFRRAVAGTRSRLAELDSIYRQATRMPHYVDTHIDLNGLKALADHTSAGAARFV
ncbi:hypothetical protein [Pseudomonas petrae]|uniref:hypothetical protein n=1 Tax=Pseudomonas petrae TaxID=2912190 RepID=UPI001F40ABB9|nr:hypothetical protein [Pseudomonas petrae]MCF7532006.1 hypothetical protein [Pseudomonas petrae]